MKNIASVIVDSVTKIKEDDWDLIFGDIPEGYGFYKTLEESGLEAFSFYYQLLYQDKELISIAPLFVTDFNADIAAEGVMERVIHYARRYVSPRFLIFKSLFYGSPFGEHGILGIKEGINKKEAIIEIMNRVSQFCRGNNIRLVIFKDFLEQDALSLDSLLSRGFFKVNSFPSVVTELKFSTLDEYLSSLGRSTRKSLRKKIKKAYASADTEVKISDNIENVSDEVLRLYENIYRNGSTKFERLTKDFFTKVGNNLTPNSKFFLYYVKGKLSAFNLCFIYKDLFIDKFIGLDYDISKKYNLYFVSWCNNVEWCLKNSIRFYQSGQTDYHPKLKLGGKLVPLYAYFKHRNQLLNPALKAISVFLKPENFDEDIRRKADV